MSRTWVRLSLVIFMLVAISLSSYRVILSEQQRQSEDATFQLYEARAFGLTTSLTEIRSTQRAYVASGQNPEEWFGQATEQLDNVISDLSELGSTSRSEDAVLLLDEVRGLVERLRRVDEAARIHASTGEALLASDLVFSDGQELSVRAIQLLDQAWSFESEARSGAIYNLRSFQLALIASAILSAIITSLFLFPLPKQIAQRSSSENGLDMGEGSADTSLSLGRSSQVKHQVSSQNGASKKERESSSQLRDVPDISCVASLCTKLSRISAAKQLHDTLTEACELLNASGLVLWVNHRDNKHLHPALGSGYPQEKLSQLGNLSYDGDNATAAAYRDATLQVVPGDEDVAGAVAAPLLATADDNEPCVGVLAIELRQGWEGDETVQAFILILAAQLATLVSPDANGIATAEFVQTLPAVQDQSRTHG